MNTTIRAETRQQLIIKATELRAQGKSLREIGKALGISTTSAHYMLKGTKSRAKRRRVNKPSLLTVPVESKKSERVLEGFATNQTELLRFLISQHRDALDRLERSLS